MINEYEYPAEMPEIHIDDNIAIIDFGTTIITPAHLVHCSAQRRKLRPGEKMPVMLIGEFATDIFGEISNLGSNPWIVEVTKAVALVATANIGSVIGEIYMKLQNNPYPTKLFNERSEAKEWLLSHVNI
ncbi:hypothetical protein [Pseudemcibacter aquimaris]|uniref:DUF7793 family protein n=1 Tax=Pseudemcibacter aquimaris TaxID=2857064 RepID=UPI002011BCE1|nr:hypothetical protein [Pseudemcibacter aquimaris]MCC3860959.1 hypothetical protein [Pseudemcibacter aquimaris]WDU59777.1 hypothetical protein KW060_05850 [Pseudemcibacter aquimaris]